ncbi:MAG: hypothetical protein AB1333_02880 [Patescibacteria group bacterium]
MDINKNEIFVGDTLPENQKEHEQTFEEVLDGLQNEFDRNEVYIADIKSGLEKDKVFWGELIELASKGEANKNDYQVINRVKDTIASSKFHLSEVLREQNHIRDLISTFINERSIRHKKLTTLKDEQKN